MDLDTAARDYRRALAGIEAAKRAAKRREAEARARAARAREALHAAMVAAARNGVRPVEIEKRTGHTKERVRQIPRAGGIEADG